MQSGLASPSLTHLAVGYHEATCEMRPDITSPAYWAGSCASASVWLVFILYAISRSLN